MGTDSKTGWLRTFIKISLPFLLLLAALIAAYQTLDYHREWQVNSRIEEGLASLGARTAERLIEVAGADVRVLSKSVSLRNYLASGSPESLSNLAQEFMSTCFHRQIYDQVRFLDTEGREVVRINRNAGSCAVVPVERLQDKGKRYYFLDAFKLESEELFISPLDLNMEGGQIEEPFKPMIRLATPVVDAQGNKRGVVLVNYLAKNLLDEVAEVMMSSSSSPFLANRNGHYLLAPPEAQAWTFMLNDGSSAPDLHDKLWSQMLAEDQGMANSKAGGFYVWDTARPLSADSVSSSGSSQANAPSMESLSGREYFWTLGTQTPASVASAWRQQRVRDGLILFFLLGGFIVATALLVARSRERERQTFVLLQKSEQRSRAVISDLAEGLIVLDANGRVHMMNPMAEQLLGWREEQLRGLDLHERIHPIPEENCPILKSLALAEPVSIHEDQFVRKDGQRLPVSYVASPFYFEGEHHGIIVAFQDITERKEVQDRLTDLATRDSLTKLLNRREIEQRLAMAFQTNKTDQTPTSILLLDIDHFKQVNDNYGHPVGDRVLQTFASLLERMIQGIGHVGRYGGEEFLLVLPGYGLERALFFAEELRRSVEALQVDTRDCDEPLQVTVSVGVATQSESDANPDKLVSRADQAMYQAKHQGRNRVCSIEEEGPSA